MRAISRSVVRSLAVGLAVAIASAPSVAQSVRPKRAASVPDHTAPSSTDASSSNLKAARPCAHALEDQTGPGCIEASSAPQLGKLYPISDKLFVDPAGRVGIGTTSPTSELEVSGTLTLAPSGDEALNISSGSVYRGGALFLHTKGGTENLALGQRALEGVTTGKANIAVGAQALFQQTTGNYNTATGVSALYYNSSGNDNVAIGTSALFFGTSGSNNTAIGAATLAYNGSDDNTAIGHRALFYNNLGEGNVGVGLRALFRNTSGYRNIGIGFEGGYSLTTGDDNVAIANTGVAGESATTRIGSAQTRAFVAGIRGTTTGVADGIPVLVDSAGQLGTVSSSLRFKEEVEDMGASTDKLLELRPVTFRFKPEVQAGERPVEYGLIAEEVAEVFPDLVVYGDDGEPFTVKYHILSSMLLNELQKLRADNEAQERDLAELRERLRLIEAAIND